MPDQINNAPIPEPTNYGQPVVNSDVTTPPAPAAPPPAPAKRSRGPVWLVACVVLVIIIVVVALLVGHKSKTTPSAATSAPPRVVTVSIDSKGFTPTTLNVSANTTVTWTATDAGPYIVASNPYPKDTILPGLKSQQLGQNAHYSYDFKKAGTYQYHDDLHPETNGTIVVK